MAERCDAPFVARPRRGTTLARIQRQTGADLLYVVRKERDELHGADQVLHIHPGMFYLRREAGPTHPLIRALAPAAAPAPAHIVDATIGLAQDALHVAYALDVVMTGVEASPVVGALLTEGLRRLAADGRAWSPAAARITLRLGPAREVLAGMPDRSADAVFLDPMFDHALDAQHGFDAFRRVAVHDPLTVDLLTEALRVAAARVVLKLPALGAAPTMPGLPPWNRRVRGGAVDYAIIERALAAPEWEGNAPGP